MGAITGADIYIVKVRECRIALATVQVYLPQPSNVNLPTAARKASMCPHKRRRRGWKGEGLGVRAKKSTKVRIRVVQVDLDGISTWMRCCHTPPEELRNNKHDSEFQAGRLRIDDLNKSNETPRIYQKIELFVGSGHEVMTV